MLRLVIPSRELWDGRKSQFVYTKEQTLQLEHSLISISKWESKWQKAFLSRKEKTQEESIDYIRCMLITPNVDSHVISTLSSQSIEVINEYISAPMTATYFREDKSERGSREVVTAELIYYWMISLNIPFECQKWHLNRLLALIRTCSIKNSPPKKRSTKEIMSQNAALNAARRKQLNTRG